VYPAGGVYVRVQSLPYSRCFAWWYPNEDCARAYRAGIADGSISSSAVMCLEDRVSFQCVGCHTGNAKHFTDPLTGEKK
jgi:hypothetical protein